MSAGALGDETLPTLGCGAPSPRDSKLTSILRPTFAAANAKVLLIANVAPAHGPRRRRSPLVERGGREGGGHIPGPRGPWPHRGLLRGEPRHPLLRPESQGAPHPHCHTEPHTRNPGIHCGLPPPRGFKGRGRHGLRSPQGLTVGVTDLSGDSSGHAVPDCALGTWDSLVLGSLVLLRLFGSVVCVGFGYVAAPVPDVPGKPPHLFPLLKSPTDIRFPQSISR